MKNEKYIIENYSYNKGVFSKDKECVLDEIRFEKKEKSYYIDSKKYMPASLCDKNITKIRNTSSYNHMIDSVCVELNKRYSQCKGITDIIYAHRFDSIFNFQTLCPEDYQKFEKEKIQYLIKLWESTYTKKNNRLNYYTSEQHVNNQDSIDLFLRDFVACAPDFEVLKYIIYKNSDMFVLGINKLSEKDFILLMTNLFYLPKTINKKHLRRQLKEVDTRSVRIKELIRVLRYP